MTGDDLAHDMREGVLVCSACGASLGFDPEDDPDGAGPGQPLCGECNRNVNWMADEDYLDLLEDHDG